MVSRKDAGRRLDARDGRPSVAERMQTSDGANDSLPQGWEQEEVRKATLLTERYVLGAAMDEPHRAVEILGHLQSDDFLSIHHAWVAAAIRELDRSGKEPNAVAVVNRLTELKKIDEVGTATVSEMQLEYAAQGGTAELGIGYRETLLARSNDRRVREQVNAIAAGAHGKTADELRSELRQVVETSETSRSPLADSLASWTASEIHRPPPTRWSLRFPDRDGVKVEDGQGDGLMRPGKCALLTAEGGVGKTTALVQMGISMALGTPWLGYFEPDSSLEGSKTLLVLGENSEEESQEMFWRVCEDLGLTDAERATAKDRVVILSMAGKDIGFMSRDMAGTLVPTSMPDEVLRIARDGGFRTIVLDSVVRIAGATRVDVDNTETLRLWVEIERIAINSDAQMWVVNHTNKASRGHGQKPTGRGASALSDSARLEILLSHHDNGRVKLALGKTNICKPFEPIILQRHGRVLSHVAGAVVDREEQDRDDARIEALCQHAIETVRLNGGNVKGRTDLKKLMRQGANTDRLTAIVRVIADGRLVEGGTARKPELRVAAPKSLPVAPEPKPVEVPRPAPKRPADTKYARAYVELDATYTDSHGVVRERRNLVPNTLLRVKASNGEFRVASGCGKLVGLPAYRDSHQAHIAAHDLWKALPPELRKACGKLSASQERAVREYGHNLARSLQVPRLAVVN